MSTESIMTGVYLMIIGMGTVFVFLMIMVYAMNLTHKIITFINKFYPEENIETKSSSNKKQKNDDTEIAIAICCAVQNKG